MSTENYALVLMGDRVACFQSSPADPSWRVTRISGDAWVSLHTHSVPAVLQQLSERRNLNTRLAHVPVTLVYEQAAVGYLAGVAEAFEALQCRTWQVLRYEPLAERVTRAPGEQHRAHDETWLAESLLVCLDGPAPVAPVSVEVLPGTLQVGVLQLYLPMLFQHFWSSVSPQDLAFIAGSLQVPDVESPYPEPSQDAIAVLRRRFLNLPAAQRQAVLGVAHELSYKLKVRAQLRDLLEGL
ncbi:hypothetical protein SAMN04487857_107204 [Pseudomonas sp. ok272]|uniref:hypothetical protein n=1 Tax=unclassified Pseudomonas TaxID=196821 RepID=UPI0008B38B2D|nr:MULTISPECIES: hypothetical protein [unclassified Pseudomonas]SEM95613.1 hypothetical protein SAMN04487857_107204 [Pseudomonas sp. ok272]SFM92772.1 hypothetical protein SAMN04487858_10913 [Pseudomonas sp. ok602]